MIKELSHIIQGAKHKYVVHLHQTVNESTLKTYLYGCETMDEVLKCIRENYRNGEWIYIQEKRNENRK